jgi:hypothetical protein
VHLVGDIDPFHVLGRDWAHISFLERRQLLFHVVAEDHGGEVHFFVL